MNTEETMPSTPMTRMIAECNSDEVIIGERISAVLEFLTLRSVMDGPYKIYTDDKSAVAIFAANDDVEAVVKGLPDNVKDWNDMPMDDVEEFDTDRDPGDEQEPDNEPAA